MVQRLPGQDLMFRQGQSVPRRASAPSAGFLCLLYRSECLLSSAYRQAGRLNIEGDKANRAPATAMGGGRRRPAPQPPYGSGKCSVVSYSVAN